MCLDALIFFISNFFKQSIQLKNVKKSLFSFYFPETNIQNGLKDYSINFRLKRVSKRECVNCKTKNDNYYFWKKRIIWFLNFLKNLFTNFFLHLLIYFFTILGFVLYKNFSYFPSYSPIFASSSNLFFLCLFISLQRTSEKPHNVCQKRALCAATPVLDLSCKWMSFSNPFSVYEQRKTLERLMETFFFLFILPNSNFDRSRE